MLKASVPIRSTIIRHLSNSREKEKERGVSFIGRYFPRRILHDRRSEDPALYGSKPTVF